MKKLNAVIKYVLAVLFLNLIVITAYGQKLPNVQETSVWSPLGVKIDGNPTEWGHFQAHNKGTDIYYTIANDKNRLYLVIQARGEDIIQKIAEGGITFTVNSSDEKKDKEAVSVVFPQFDKYDPPVYLMLFNRPQAVKDSMITKMQTDSFRKVLNYKVDNKYKIIGINGITTIKDSILSIYNSEGIKAAAQFNDRIWYTYELCIPLKYLALQSTKFKYSIQLNGAAYGALDVQLIRGRIVFTGRDGVRYGLSDTPEQMNIAFPTHFSGEYTLVKK